MKQQLFDECKPYLVDLISIVNNIGCPMEGSLFFDDKAINMNFNKLSQTALDKAESLAGFATDKKELLEIGFNSGFSALVFLVSNPTVNVTSIDTCYWPYVKPCYAYLKEKFKDRITLVEGKSEDALKKIFENNNNFDAYFIDGGHNEHDCNMDFTLIIENCKNNSIICADDYDMPIVKTTVDKFIGTKQLDKIAEGKNNIFLKVIK